ncbi:MAG: hypothetical protein IRY87_00075 [Acetobacteraceae bacterium]|nr:hypothetical protein [Acetobacteraceae bacterium]
MAYVPRGYLTLSEALAKITEHRAPELTEEVRLSEPVMRLLDFQDRMARGIRAARSLSNIGGLPSPPPPMLTDDKAARLEELRRLQEQLRTVEKAAARDLQQALGEGDLAAHFLDAHGTLQPIPPEQWRTDRGLQAVRAERTLWTGGPGAPPLGAPILLEEKAFIRWLAPPQAHSQAQETRLIHWLADLMRANPTTPRSKAEVRSSLPSELQGVSDRGFERAWAEAVRLSRATAWRAPGRRKSPR